MTPEEKPSSAEPSMSEQLGRILDEANMQVTFTGWKAELEATEAKLKAQAAQVSEAVKKLERVGICLTGIFAADKKSEELLERAEGHLDAALALLKEGTK